MRPRYKVRMVINTLNVSTEVPNRTTRRVDSPLSNSDRLTAADYTSRPTPEK